MGSKGWHNEPLDDVSADLLGLVGLLVRGLNCVPVGVRVVLLGLVGLPGLLGLRGRLSSLLGADTRLKKPSSICRGTE